MRETCVIVDGHSLMYRAFHALPPMDSDGVHTNALHGFLSMLFRVFEERAPQYCVVAFDEHGPTFRHEAYAEYKAGRQPMPEELREQFPIVRELLQSMGVGVLSLKGYEADDLLGAVSRQCRDKGLDSLLVTGDRDALQLVDDGILLLYTRKGISETQLFTPSAVKEQYGITPAQVPDWKGLTGDASDNIPGVPGVGDKTAVRLLNDYGSLEGVLEHAGEIKGKLGENLRAHAQEARFAKQLATIDSRAPVGVDLSSWMLNRLEEGLPSLQKYRLNSAGEKMKRLLAARQPAGHVSPPAPSGDAAWEDLAEADAVSAFLRGGASGPLTLHLADDALTVVRGDGRRARVPLATGQQDLFSRRRGLLPEKVLGALSGAMAARSLVTHDAKTLFHRLHAVQLPVPPLKWDTMIAAYLHNPLEKSYSLQQLGEYSAGGVADLAGAQEKQLRDEGMSVLYETIELPLVRVLFDMEAEGFQVDRKVLEDLGSQFTKRSAELQDMIYSSTGVSGFNLNSPQQLGKVLFDTLGLPSRKKTQLGGSTDADTLEGLSGLHPSIPMILEYRQVVKLNGTYIDSLLRKVSPAGRIHTTFDQTSTATGRISSNEPNLQNIPVRTPLGRDIRKAFVAKEGFTLVDADYSQIELRILAHMSGDEAMCDAFVRGQDIHTRTAAEINGVAMEEVTAQMRSAAKAVNFGIVYGISDFGLARNIGITQRRAADFISRYFDRYPGVHAFMQQAVRDGFANEYAATLYGRRRPLPELRSSNFNTRSFGERAAMNTPIQGTAADIIKAAMVRVHERLLTEGYASRLILQVHDELLIEAPREEALRVSAMLKECMEQVLPLRVPLVCDVKTGRSWYETK